MVEAKAKRVKKRQLGQYMTPSFLAREVLREAKVSWSKKGKYLEPSFGQGSFLVAAIEELLAFYGNRSQETLNHIFENQIFGVELDEFLYAETIDMLRQQYGKIPTHNLIQSDFFQVPYMNSSFDLVFGNPPFGGTFDPRFEDALDRRFGKWQGKKVKKETYSFFISASLDLLRSGGRLLFLSSDTFLTINTMSGLRHRLMDEGQNSIRRLSSFSDETVQSILVLDVEKGSASNFIEIDGQKLTREMMSRTANFSWNFDAKYRKYFSGKTVGDFLVCSSGMTVGDNDLFVRKIENGCISEPYSFEFFEDAITMSRELERARLNQLSPQMMQKIEQMELSGVTRRNLRVVPLTTPLLVSLPNEDYRPYNKATSGIVYKPTQHVIFWKDDGDAVLTFKKNGAWYLHGVGGAKYFGRSGLTWSLVSNKINMRFLDAGHILDSGAPCAFLREGIHQDELWFIFAWCLSDLASDILKSVINHTRNIQGKDIERLPYPTWVSSRERDELVNLIKEMVNEARAGRIFNRSDIELRHLSEVFSRVEA